MPLIMLIKRKCSLYSVMSRYVPGMLVGGEEASREHSSAAKFNSGQWRYIEADYSAVLSALARQETQGYRTVKALKETLIWMNGGWRGTQLVTSCFTNNSKVYISSNMCMW